MSPKPAMDYSNPQAALTGALEWAGREPMENRLRELWFGQRDPGEVGPGLFFWIARLDRALCNGMPGASDSLHQRVVMITDAWDEFRDKQAQEARP